MGDDNRLEDELDDFQEQPYKRARLEDREIDLEEDADSEEEVDLQPTAQDQQFLEQPEEFGNEEDEEAGMPWAGGDEEGDEGDDLAYLVQGGGDEGQEDPNLLDNLTSRGGKKKGGIAPDEAILTATTFKQKMDQAVEQDMIANTEGQPAIHKLKMLREVEDMLANRFLHPFFLDAGLLASIKAWIEPLPDGSLPNEEIRSAVLKLLLQLPIDTALQHRREQLKLSKLGMVVMFLYKLEEETPSNKRAARELIERWSRPVLNEYKSETEYSRSQELENETRMIRQQRIIKEQEMQQRKKNIEFQIGRAHV
eukprot:TRINITY_DN1451_c0_g1_i2.p1 TRINITY_DN1451_c0_g1~~TRINITY_DN1451_c0_g1_i2.p1  ORF type:complete len:310 (-),score=83.02 TRINITY_DN1451_c0_g1_i2:75-1004(-)